MKTWKKFLIALLVILLLIQFFRPQKNISAEAGSYGINRDSSLPVDVHTILKASCYDCHSNNTVYPWYAEVQPVAWWLNNHVQEGKKELNFSEFYLYPASKQYKKLGDINDEIKDDGMPLPSYLIIHRYAKLDTGQKLLITNWVSSLRAKMKREYPADSLLKNKSRY